MTAHVIRFGAISAAADNRVQLAREIMLMVGLPPAQYRWACGVLLALSDDATDHANARAMRAALDEDDARAAEAQDATEQRRLNVTAWLLLTLIPAMFVWGYVGALLGQWWWR